MKKVQFDTQGKLSKGDYKKLREFVKKEFNLKRLPNINTLGTLAPKDKRLKNKEKIIKRALKYFVKEFNKNVEEEEITKKKKIKMFIKEPKDNAFNNSYLQHSFSLDIQIPKEIYEVPEINKDFIKNKINKMFKPAITKLKKTFTKPIKVWFSLNYLSKKEGDEIPRFLTVAGKSTPVLEPKKKLLETFQQQLNKMLNDMFKEEYVQQFIIFLKDININITDYNPLEKKAGTYQPLPDRIKNKNAIINIKNDDNLCFIYSVLCHIIKPESHPERVGQYKKNLDKIKFDEKYFIDGGISVYHEYIHTFEEHNKLNINIYGYDDKNKNIIPLRFSKKNYDICNLFYYNNHYSYIKNVDRFFNDGNKKGFHCPRCIKFYRHKEKRDEHFKECNLLDVKQKSMMPISKKTEENKENIKKLENYIQRKTKKNIHIDFFYTLYDYLPESIKKLYDKKQETKMINKVCIKFFKELYEKETKEKLPLSTTTEIKSVNKFKNFDKMNKLPIIIYGDFEALNKKLDVNEGEEGLKKMTEHKSASYRFYIKSDIPLNIPLDYEYCGENANIHFVETIMNIEKELQNAIKQAIYNNKDYKNMIISDEEKEEFYQNGICRFCNDKIKKGDKVKDHCHFTGKYRGVSCRKCNLQARINPNKVKIPFVFHNLNYDLRQVLNGFIDLNLVEKDEHNNTNMNCIATNSENFKTLSLNSYSFIDSFAFISSSLEELISNVPDEEKTAMRKITDDEELFKLICKKGEFPYEWFDSFEKLKEDTLIPERELFFNTLRDCNLTEEEYNDMLVTCEKFNIKNFKQFHDLYLKRDVYGLCDVFQLFRKISMNSYGLDPAHYIGTPSFAWDAMLKLTKIELELLTDEDMYMFFEKGIRGGISKAVLRHVKANNKYLPDYDEKKLTNFLMYIDSCNLYGLSMIQKLPYKNFEWMTQEELTNFKQNIYNLDVDSNEGYTVEVTLNIPEEIHDLTADYPLCPNHKNIKESEISKYSKEALKGTKFDKNNFKLCCDLDKKIKYVVHSKILKLYVELGVKIEAIHRGIKYEQKEWLKEYIDFNTDKRKKSKTDYEKDYYKLMNNAVFGKSMENVRNRTAYRFAMNKKRFDYYTSKPEFKDLVDGVGNENFRIVRMENPTVKLNKPIYAGQAILDLSKHHMYDFYYNKLKRWYGDNVRLVGTDTDSYILSINTEDVYKDIEKYKYYFDTHNYPKNHYLYSNENKKVVGKFGDEVIEMKNEKGEKNENFKLMSDVVFIRSKVYSYKVYDTVDKKYYEKNVLKGISKIVKDKYINYDDYEKCINNKTIQYRKVNAIRSFNLKNYSIQQNKKALSFYDDKRYILPNGVDTLPYGHYKINKIKINKIKKFLTEKIKRIKN